MKNHKTFENSTIFEALKKIFPDSSNTTLRNLIKKRRVYVDNVLIENAKEIIEKNKTISICEIIKKSPSGIKIIYEDNDILVINKPESLLCVPLDEVKTENALSILRKFYSTKNIFVVHRIDKKTSGVMMFAKNQRAVDKLNVMFKNHELKRSYLAIVEGNLKENEGAWKSYLVENKEYNVRSVENEEEGKIAITHFSVIRRSKNFTYLKLNLETGRKHQIRVHCKDAGHPILGDKRYSPLASPISRMCLHSSLLEFLHPITEKKMSFSAPVPQSFKKLGVIKFSND
ncbi:MAG: Ribosomal large subunit pseudouridine synthase D [Candidatus Anoxychlamydiales bacterium]|nr:Ribosomal large subunit pseudouridine synthase D [Candidatus Anoxychlamydiales bacterium]